VVAAVVSFVASTKQDDRARQPPRGSSGLISRSDLKRVVNNHAVAAQCQEKCPMGAITDDPRTVKAGRVLQ